VGAVAATAASAGAAADANVSAGAPTGTAVPAGAAAATTVSAGVAAAVAASVMPVSATVTSAGAAVAALPRGCTDGGDRRRTRTWLVVHYQAGARHRPDGGWGAAPGSMPWKTRQRQ